jgi:hypothetical protein
LFYVRLYHLGALRTLSWHPLGGKYGAALAQNVHFRDTVLGIRPTMLPFVGCSAGFILRSVDAFVFRLLFGILSIAFSQRLHFSSTEAPIQNNRMPKEIAPAAAGAINVLL